MKNVILHILSWKDLIAFGSYLSFILILKTIAYELTICKFDLVYLKHRHFGSQLYMYIWNEE